MSALKEKVRVRATPYQQMQGLYYAREYQHGPTEEKLDRLREKARAGDISAAIALEHLES